MAINYKRELEEASRSMILVHEPDTLIKLIVRRIVQKVKVNHAGILLHDKERDTYVLSISRGAKGLKIPKGFARMDADNPLIRFFRQHQDQKLFKEGCLVYDKARKLLKKNIPGEAKQILRDALYQMEIFEAWICIPSYFRGDLLGILLLGSKRRGRKFAQDELDFFVALASDVAMAIRNAQLFQELEIELQKEHRLFIHTTIALAAAIDAKDHYTHGHTARVTTLSLEIAKLLGQKNKKNFDEEFLENLHIASLLHDIGKIGIPESILNKDKPLDPEEEKKMHEHPVLGTSILQPIRELGPAISGVKYHHEKYDGSGYPEGLKGNSIPLVALIISVADAFDAMTTDRPYRKGLSMKEAIEEIRRGSGRQFDPQIASVLVELYQENKV
ncbi:MAG: HD domain-containing protein [Candidatus Omnitrophica bacterium]|nr:HD domain-containing protein [Candidatus Omnitrophota bacterium]